MTAPIEDSANIAETDDRYAAIESLDSMDSILLSVIVEIEQATTEELSFDELEGRLKQFWQNTYTRFANLQESLLSTYFIWRGCNLREKIYQSKELRRRLYHTGLPPRSGNRLLEIQTKLVEHLRKGTDYVRWTEEQKTVYIEGIYRQLIAVSQYAPDKKMKTSTLPEWENILRWWLAPKIANLKPERKNIALWHKFVSDTFLYRFNWGLGSVIALTTDSVFEDKFFVLTLKDWPSTQLPWIVFWLKELITWGTLDPVAAYLLSRKIRITRERAQETAMDYYRMYANVDPNNVLEASKIRNWAESISQQSSHSEETRLHLIAVRLLRDFDEVATKLWRVIPVVTGEILYWLDPAGFALAQSDKPERWEQRFLENFDFFLDSEKRQVTSQVYF